MEYRSGSDFRRGDGYYKLRIITQEGGGGSCLGGGGGEGYDTDYVRNYSVGGWWGLGELGMAHGHVSSGHAPVCGKLPE